MDFVQDTCYMRLEHSGEVVNIYSEYGANECLKQHETKDDFTLFSDMLERAHRIRKKARKKKKKLNASEEQILGQTYTTVMSLTAECDPKLFRERVPEREIKACIDHAAGVFQELAEDRRWIRTGEMEGHNGLLLSSCCYLFSHPLPAVIVFEDDTFFESILALLDARKGDIFPWIAYSIEETICQMFVSTVDLFDNRWKPEKAFKKLEAAGLLKHFIQFSAMERPPLATSEGRDCLFKQLLPCIAFIKKRFKAGTPCGDTLRALLNSRNTAICPHAMPYLQNLLKLSNTLQETSQMHSSSNYHVCQNCEKEDEQNKFMKCSRCKRALYCSKECQRADWQQHKPICQFLSKTCSKRGDAISPLVADFAGKYFVKIMVKMVEETEKEGGLGMKDVVIELDFNPDENGNVPVLQETAQFKIIPTSKYLQAEVERKILSAEYAEDFRAHLNDRDGTPDVRWVLLFSMQERAATGLQITDPVTGADMYREEVLEAFRQAYLHGEYDQLVQILPPDTPGDIQKDIEMLKQASNFGQVQE